MFLDVFAKDPGFFEITGTTALKMLNCSSSSSKLFNLCFERDSLRSDDSLMLAGDGKKIIFEAEIGSGGRNRQDDLARKIKDAVCGRICF